MQRVRKWCKKGCRLVHWAQTLEDWDVNYCLKWREWLSNPIWGSSTSSAASPNTLNPTPLPHSPKTAPNGPSAPVMGIET